MKKLLILSAGLFLLLQLDASPSLEFDTRMSAGIIEFMEYDEFGQPMFRVNDGIAIYEYAYYGEVMEWIESGNFEYNDELINQ